MSHTTHDRDARAAAQERLFEATLAEIVTGDPLAQATPAEPPAVRAALRTAAALLLGLGVAISVWWLRASPSDEAWQEPAPMPMATTVADGQALARLDRATVAIRIEAVRPADFALLPSFPALRSVSMNPDSSAAGQRAWQRADVETLEPLTRCANLEVLELPFTVQLEQPHLDLLARCPKLRTFEARGASLHLDRTTARRLASWPALRRLRLLACPLTAGGVRALAELPHLRTLEFYRCDDLDDGPFEAIAELDQLRSLRITGLGQEPPPKVVLRPPSSWQPNVRQLRGLRALENLRSLTLLGPSWSAERIDALPRQLTRLAISSNQVIPSHAIRSMRRFQRLEHLGFGRIGGDEAELRRTADDVADLLGSLQLTSFDWARVTTPKLARAIGGQPLLRELDLTWPPGLDLAPLRGLPALRKLTLAARWSAPGKGGPATTPTTEQLAATLRPLADCRSLQTVTVFATLTERDEQAMRAALPERIELRLY